MNFRKFVVIPAFAAVLSVSAFSPAKEQQPPPVAKATRAPEPTVVRVYDIRDLVAASPEFPLLASTYAHAFISPTGQSTSGPSLVASQGAGQPVANGLFGGGATANVPDPKAETKKLTDDLVKLIEDNVDRESWQDNGGMTGTLREMKGLFVITQTEANHKKIAELLGNISREQGGMVRVNADWLLLNSADVAKLSKGSSEEALAPIDPAALQNLPAGARHFAGQTLSRNGQTVYVISGTSRSLVTSSIPVVSTGVAAYSTDVSSVGAGIALEVSPRVNWETKSAVVTVFSTFSDPAKVTNDRVSLYSATTQPDGGHQVSLAPTASFQPFSRSVQDLRTTIRVPLGVTVIAGSMTLNPQTQGDEEQQLVLLLKVTASK